MAKNYVTVDRSEKRYTVRDSLDANGKPEKEALVFKFIPLSKRQLAVFQDSSTRMSMSSNTILLGNASVNIDIFKEAITGFENLQVNGAMLQFKKDLQGRLHDDVIEDIPLELIEEVSTHIVKVSKFPEEEKGK